MGTVTDLNVYHTVIDFDAHGLRRFVTNLVVLEKTDDPGPTASERRAISKVRLREERAAAKIAKANPPPPRPSRRRAVTTDDDATPA